MRPQIPDALEARIEDVMNEGGYTSKGELIRDATRRYVDSIERGPMIDDWYANNSDWHEGGSNDE